MARALGRSVALLLLVCHGCQAQPDADAACTGGAAQSAWCAASADAVEDASLLQHRASAQALVGSRKLPSNRTELLAEGPPPQEHEDFRLLEMRIADDHAQGLPTPWFRSVPHDWAGPKKPPLDQTLMLWGGPSKAYQAQSFAVEAFPSDQVEHFMNYAKAGSSIPKELHGIWWMDQYGFSSVAKSRSYTFAFAGAGTPEVLASFGEGGDDGAAYEQETRCVTPITLYGGNHWTAQDNQGGRETLAFHQGVRNTLSFCFTNDTHEEVQIYQKMLAPMAALGPFRIGAVAAALLGFYDADDGYVWTPNSLMSMGMVKKPWGWDRVTAVLDTIQDVKAPFWQPLLNLLKEAQRVAVAHYPLIQVVDGYGKRTKYYDEYLAFMKTVPGGGAATLVSGPVR